MKGLFPDIPIARLLKAFSVFQVSGVASPFEQNVDTYEYVRVDPTKPKRESYSRYLRKLLQEADARKWIAEHKARIVSSHETIAQLRAEIVQSVTSDTSLDVNADTHDSDSDIDEPLPNVDQPSKQVLEKKVDTLLASVRESRQKLIDLQTQFSPKSDIHYIVDEHPELYEWQERVRQEEGLEEMSELGLEI